MIEPTRLLALLGGFSERDYLQFLASRVPSNVAEQVTDTSALHLIDDLDTQDLLAPLKGFSFLRDKRGELDSYFDEVTMGLLFDPSEYTPCVAIYLCSLHLYLYAKCEGGNDSTPQVAAVMVDQCLDADLETRVHVLKFLLWVSAEIGADDSRRLKYRPFYILAVCMLWSSVLEDLVDVTKRYADEAPKSKLFEERGILAHSSYDITWRKLMERVFGSEGHVVETANRCQRVFGRRGYKRGKTEGG